jgi:hypothetical protein
MLSALDLKPLRKLAVDRQDFYGYGDMDKLLQTRTSPRAGSVATILSGSSVFAVVALLATAIYGDEPGSITVPCKDLHGRSGRAYYLVPLSGDVHQDSNYSPSTRSFRMAPERQEYKGHRIELRAHPADERRAREGKREEELDLLIDDQPVHYGSLPDGSYALQEYAYDWSDNLMDLAKKFIDYRDRADKIRREAEAQ